ncbi:MULTISPECIES: DcaP family trimeric outer membrane transporter [unclassified Acinetobacter]|uniref:DcaP family trimeric outer membrane transporter n=1 Tax=unclassified Acinetobacter TaxID=196816 RepID=UPI0015D3C5B3|nr:MULTISPECIES: DcaP family trimeric outer membrane transporter [unclassified Acinetobacter]
MDLIRHKLAVALLGAMCSSAIYAADSTEQQQIQELRQELDALKAWVAQQKVATEHQAQAKPAVTLVPAAVPQVEQSNPATLKSKAGAEVNLYGFIRADAAYQFEGGTGIFNRINNIALDDDPNKRKTEKRFDSTATATRIGLDFKAPVPDHDVNGKIEIDFRGGASNDTVRIRHAYVSVDNWLLGQTTSTFLSTETLPELLDFNGVLGGGVFRTQMVRYSDSLNANTQYMLGLEKSSSDNQYPTLAAKLTHKFEDGKGFVNVRGMAQEVRARTDEKDYTDFGWGVGVGLKYKPIAKLNLTANYAHAVGDDKYFLYNSSNSIPKANDIDLVEFDAVNAGATYQFTPKIRSTLGYGALFYDENVVNGNDNLQQGWLNVMYNPFKPVTFGVEYIYGERKTLDNKSGTDSRLEFMAKYDF